MYSEETKRSFLSVGSSIVCLIFLVTLVQGCEPLAKKFKRNKKGEEDQAQYEPILDPIDYPAKVYDPKADYKYRFSLFHVWEKELVAGLDDRTSVKRLKYFNENIIIQLQEMEKLLSDDKKAGLQKAIQGFNGITDALNQPSQFYNLQDLKRNAENYAKPILLQYTPSSVEENVKPKP